MKAEISAGTIIHRRYRIDSLLGQGGLGRTYLAFDLERFEERCVLKEFAPNGISKQSLQKAEELFNREAQLLHQLKHPQIPKFYAYFEEDQRLFLVQEFIEGKTYAALLDQRLTQNQVFSEAEVVQLLRAILPVLGTVHAQGILHRDISIDNIMLSDQVPILIDFGVGTRTHSDVKNQGLLYHSNSSFVGKYGYSPFEQLSQGQCSSSGDLYALGVSAIALLTGKPPVHLTAQSLESAHWRTHTTISEAFAKVLLRMVAEQPESRYQTANQVLTALSQVASPSVVQQAPWQGVTFMPDVFVNKVASRPLHFIWICDGSQSMAVDGKIQALNTAIAEVIPHMQAAAAANPNAEVLVRAIRFAKGAEWLVPEPTPIEDFRWTPMAAQGDTDLGTALQAVAEQLQATAMNGRSLPPVLVLVSDGQPTDDYLKGLDALLNQPLGQKAIRIAIAIGRDVDHDVLQQFIGHSGLRPLRANSPEALVRQIKWASTVLLKAASAPIGLAQPAIANLPPIVLPASTPSSKMNEPW